mmetsp:Transcript_9431/g.24439  ORF Transcript_9431/g.24439 Transcript_9431/m.24439 type:complete len:280 (-) Transcript_9431:2261-3100(-)
MLRRPQMKSGTFASHCDAAEARQIAWVSVTETHEPSTRFRRSYCCSSFRESCSSLMASLKLCLNSAMLMSQRRIPGKGLCVTQWPPSPSSSPSMKKKLSPGFVGSMPSTSGPICHGVSSGTELGSRRQVPMPIQSAMVKLLESATHCALEQMSLPSSSFSNSKRILPTATEGRSSRTLFLKALVFESSFCSIFFLSCSFSITIEALSLYGSRSPLRALMVVLSNTNSQLLDSCNSSKRFCRWPRYEPEVIVSFRKTPRVTCLITGARSGSTISCGHTRW